MKKDTSINGTRLLESLKNSKAAGVEPRYVPAQWGDDEKSGKVEVVTFKEHNLPMLHFSWTAMLFVYIESAEEAAELAAMGFEVEKNRAYGNEKQTWNCYTNETRESHLWFCNFRRYSWSWSPSADGHNGGGFASGPVYANGHHFHGMASTPEDVVRLSAVEAWAQFTRENLPGFFFTKEIQEVFAELVIDACNNVSRHANPSHSAYSDGKNSPRLTRRVMSENDRRQTVH